MVHNLRAVMRRHGSPDLLELVEEPAPEPAPGQIRIRVETAGVSPADLLICWGLHPEARRPPFTPGWDVIGVVDRLGADVHAPPACEVGRRVAALTVVNGFSRWVCISAGAAVPVPDGLAPAAAQCLPFDFTVAYQMIHRVARVAPGAVVLIQGAAGSVGSALLQLGHLLNLRMYGTASTSKTDEVARQGGIAIDYTRTDFIEILRAREPDGAAAVFDGVGHTLWRSYRCVARGGVLVAFGHAPSVMGGHRNWGRLFSTLVQYGAVFACAPFSGRQARLYSIQELQRRHPDWYRADLTALFELLRTGRIAPRVFGELPLAAARSALQAVSDGRVKGKLILRVADSIHGSVEQA